jgi:hypothetical protein
VANSEPGFSSSVDYDTPMAGNGEPLTVRSALQTISKLEGLEIGLFQRTEGITNIVWGLVTAGMFFAYFALGAMYPTRSDYWGPILWMPWIAAGVLSTMAVWRSAHLAAQMPTDSKQNAQRGFRYMAVFTLVMFLGFVVFGVFLSDADLRLKEPGYMMGLMSLAILLVASLTRGRATLAARRGHVVVGVLGLLSTVVLAFAAPTAIPETYFLQTIVAALVLGGGWLVSGMLLTLKG